MPVDIQGECSYSVYAGAELEYVVRFRLESLALKTEVVSQVNEAYGSLAPKVFFKGKVGDGEGQGEPLYPVCPMKPTSGIYKSCIPRFPPDSNPSSKPVSTPGTISCLYPFLLHRDFGPCNTIVDEVTYHLVGVIDWAKAQVCPLGLNLHSLQSLTGKLHLRDGWTLLEDYGTLQDVFWGRLTQEVGGLSDDQLRTIKLARALGVLLSR